MLFACFSSKFLDTTPGETTTNSKVLCTGVPGPLALRAMITLLSKDSKVSGSQVLTRSKISTLQLCRVSPLGEICFRISLPFFCHLIGVLPKFLIEIYD